MYKVKRKDMGGREETELLRQEGKIKKNQRKISGCKREFTSEYVTFAWPTRIFFSSRSNGKDKLNTLSGSSLCWAHISSWTETDIWHFWRLYFDTSGMHCEYLHVSVHTQTHINPSESIAVSVSACLGSRPSWSPSALISFPPIFHGISFFLFSKGYPDMSDCV